jgi:hypothetical protein
MKIIYTLIRIIEGFLPFAELKNYEKEIQSSLLILIYCLEHLRSIEPGTICKFITVVFEFWLVLFISFLAWLDFGSFS